ncbi:alpha/beta fold hydrolase [Tateyamaria sp. syn59]|uniref:alpha/beta fold hydrolase n=1 Tax=Tateyamaria sp. syn59 TaxID=2576942 RepID=UPI00167884BA|nr:alpha/beta fold hydrolase [Tateyamaria sp. syn59]
MTDLIDDGDGDPIVFLHGAGVDNALWAPQRAYFRKTHRVVIPNLPGHGGVPAVSSVERMAEYVRVLLCALGLRRYALIGLSLGGMVALEIAGRWGDEVSHLAMIEAVPSVTTSSAARWGIKACLLPMLCIPPRWMARLPGRHLGAETPEAATYLKEVLPRSSAAQNHALLNLATDYDGRRHLGALAMPCAVMVGEKNLRIHARATAMADAIPDCRHLVVPGAGHIANLDAPAAVNAAIRDLLSARVDHS